jgi:hypothetical protein
MSTRCRFALLALLLLQSPALGSVALFGDVDLVGFGYGGFDPMMNATLEGLSAGQVTHGFGSYNHSYPFSPDAGDFAGTDQIYVGSVQTFSHDGYSVSAERVNGPQVFSLDFSSLVPAGYRIDTFTLGIAADDFQYSAWGQPFSAWINGQHDAGLSGVLNNLGQTNAFCHFFTYGLDASILGNAHTLSLIIDEGGDGGDGWAVDFLSVGVTTSPITPVPEPATIWLLAMGGVAGIIALRKRS